MLTVLIFEYTLVNSLGVVYLDYNFCQNPRYCDNNYDACRSSILEVQVSKWWRLLLCYGYEVHTSTLGVVVSECIKMSLLFWCSSSCQCSAPGVVVSEASRCLMQVMYCYSEWSCFTLQCYVVRSCIALHSSDFAHRMELFQPKCLLCQSAYTLVHCFGICKTRMLVAAQFWEFCCKTDWRCHISDVLIGTNYSSVPAWPLICYIITKGAIMSECIPDVWFKML